VALARVGSRSRRMTARSACLLLLAGTVHGALELTPANFDKEIIDAGKSAFIKFLAPW